LSEFKRNRSVNASRVREEEQEKESYAVVQEELARVKAEGEAVKRELNRIRQENARLNQ